jgi:hypothetical protein
MADYCEDAALAKEHPNIATYGVTAWTDQLAEATTIINRALDHGWYRAEAEGRGRDWRATPFDQTKLLSAATQLTRLAVYKTLELAFRFLMKQPEDIFDGFSLKYEDEYKKELKEVLKAGLDYDFSEDGTIDSGEKSLTPTPRTLGRM